jgi:hypothetical protein
MLSFKLQTGLEAIHIIVEQVENTSYKSRRHTRNQFCNVSLCHGESRTTRTSLRQARVLLGRCTPGQWAGRLCRAPLICAHGCAN